MYSVVVTKSDLDSCIKAAIEYNLEWVQITGPSLIWDQTFANLVV